MELPTAGIGRSRRQVYGSSPEDVRQKAVDLRHLLASGEQPPDNKTTIAVYLRGWITSRRPDQPGKVLAPKSWKDYAFQIENTIIPYLGRQAIGKLDRRRVQAWIRQMHIDGKGDRTVELAHAILRKALEDAWRDQIIPTNPAAKADIKSPVRDIPEPWTEEHCRIFLDGIRDDPDRPLHLVSITCGLRPGEVLALQWLDIDYEKKTVFSRHGVTEWEGERYLKDNKSSAGKRILPLAGVVALALKDHMTRQDELREAAGDTWADNDLVFPNKVGESRRVDTLSHQFSDKVAKLGLPHVRHYDLRRLAITLVVLETRSLLVAQKFAGHSAQSLTADLYAYLLPSVSGPAIESIVAMLMEGLDVKLAVNGQSDASEEPEPSTKRP